VLPGGTRHTADPKEAVMETAVRDTAPATLARFVERRRAGSVPPRGVAFVERRRPAPVFVVEVDDLHAPDADLVLADALDYGFGGAAPLGAATLLAGLIGPDAFTAHELPATVVEFLR
jgi:hypothetical protein